MSAELERLVEFLERTTGKRLDEARLERILELANEQQEWSRRTRDLLACTVPAPLDIVDSIPAVMLPQWHRGTEWARDAARAFHEEVEAARRRWRRGLPGRAAPADVDRPRALVQPRLLPAPAERYGAVFVWSMYLAIAADGYTRYGGPPLRALAARFAAFTDFLGMPGWADPWYLKEAQAHGVDGVVHLVHGRVAEPVLRHARARGRRHPRARDRRQQRRRPRLGRSGVRRLASSASSRPGSPDEAPAPRRPDPRRARSGRVLRAEPRAPALGRPGRRPGRGAPHLARRPEQRRHPCPARRPGPPRGARPRRRSASRRWPATTCSTPGRTGRGHDRRPEGARDRDRRSGHEHRGGTAPGGDAGRRRPQLQLRRAAREPRDHEEGGRRARSTCSPTTSSTTRGPAGRRAPTRS